MRGARGGWIAGLLIGAASFACTARSTVTPPASLISPAPAAADHCMLFPMRAENVDPAAMLSQLDGHVPSSLPSGFGLEGLWGRGGGGAGDSIGTAIWFDASCRSVAITTWASSDAIPEGAGVGRFTRTAAIPPTCASPGPHPCFSYQAHLPPGLVEVDLVGLSRPEADDIVRSIQ